MKSNATSQEISIPTSFKNRTVLITGAAGALGQVMAKAFAEEGAHVVIAARKHHRDDATKLAELLGNKAMFVPLDVADEASWSKAVSAIESELGPISVLINNAAIVAIGSVEKVAIEELRKVIDTNLIGDFLSIRAVAPSMRKLGGGSIVMISSMAALHPTPNLVAYGCSKWAIRNLAMTAAYELARDKIRVNSIHPGIIETPLAYDPKTGKALVPVDKVAIPRNADPVEIAKYVLFVASEDAAFSTGSEFVADGGYALGPMA